jgi:hypothetical protein
VFEVLVFAQVPAEGDKERSIDTQDLCKDMSVSLLLLLPCTRGHKEQCYCSISTREGRGY